MNENLKIKVTSDSTQASRDMGGFDSKMKSTIKSVATLAAGMIALKKTYDFLAKSTKMAMEQEAIFRKLQSAVEITGKAWGAASVELDNLFASLQRTTKYGDTESAEVFQRIITLTGDYNKALTGLPIALDLAASGLFDAGTAARYVGMAMTGNIEMLGRYISEFKATTNEQLKNMTASEKVAYAVDVLREKFGGLAEKELQTTAGQLKLLNNYFGDLREAIGDRFTGTVVTAGNVVLPIIKSWTAEIQAHEVAVNQASEAYLNLSDAAKWDALKKELDNVETRLQAASDPSAFQGWWNQLKAVYSELSMLSDRIGETLLAPFKLLDKISGGMLSRVWEDITGDVDSLGNSLQVDQQRVDELSRKAQGLRDEMAKLMPVGQILGLDDLESLSVYEDAVLEMFETIEYHAPRLKLEPFTQEELDMWAEEFDNLEGLEEISLDLINVGQLEDELNKIPSLLENLKGPISGTLYDMFSGEFDNIGEMWVSFLKRMAAQYLATMLVNQLVGDSLKTAEVAKSVATGTAIASAYATAAALAATASFGAAAAAGSAGILATVALSKGLALAAHGGADFIVPSGYPNDSFPMRVESGEHVSVTPSGQRSRTDELLEKVLNAINSKPVANTFIFDDVDMSRYVDRGKLRREYS